MKSIKVVLLDDEYYALKSLALELETFSNVEIVAQFDDPAPCMEYCASHAVDVLFLDIEMPTMNGFEMLETMAKQYSQKLPILVVVSAFNQYAVQAFDINALDYVVKPASAKRLDKTIKRIIVQLETSKVVQQAGLNEVTRSAVEQDHKGTSIYCFGHFTILKDGQPLRIKWRTRKAEELLAKTYTQLVDEKYIIDHVFPNGAFVQIKNVEIEKDKMTADASIYFAALGGHGFNGMEIDYQNNEWKPVKIKEIWIA